MLFARRKAEMIGEAQALPGRAQPIPTAPTHYVTGNPLQGPYPASGAKAIFALGCYWGAERKFWTVPGVWVTAVGNAGGFTPNPTYEEVCSGATGHAESVLVVYDPAKVSYEALLKIFWEAHDPTQGMRQGNDTGSQYRSAIYWTAPEQRDAAMASKTAFEKALAAKGYGRITTEIAEAGPFY
ncbi:MAG: peptide-methionine (S)-S-oxide reductase MsrA, partial [Aestuariivirga sp.]